MFEFHYARQIDLKTGEGLEELFDVKLENVEIFDVQDHVRFPNGSSNLGENEVMIIDMKTGDVYAVLRDEAIANGVKSPVLV